MSALALGACGKKDSEQPVSKDTEVVNTTVTEQVNSETPEVITEDEIPEGMAISDLTGEFIDKSLENQRPVAVMIDNEKTALPHFGVSQADVVYELKKRRKV